MKLQVCRFIWSLVLFSVFAATPLATGTTPEAAQEPLPDKFLFAIGAQTPVWQFRRPEGVAVAPDGMIYVADTGNARILRLSARASSWGHGAPKALAKDSSVGPRAWR